MKNAILFFELLNFFLKHLPKIHVLKFFMKSNKFLIYYYPKVDKNQKTFLLFSLINDTIG